MLKENRCGRERRAYSATTINQIDYFGRFLLDVLLAIGE